MEEILQILKPNKKQNNAVMGKDGNPKKELLEFLGRVAKVISEKLVGVDIVAYHITGSLLNYNYTDKSDIDFHLIVKSDTDTEKLEPVKKKVNSMGLAFSGIPLEIYFQKLGEPHTASSLYDVGMGEWIKKPLPHYGNINRYFILLLLKKLKNRYIDGITPNKAESLRGILGIMRKKGLENGEYDEMNLLYKILRNTDFLKMLGDYIKS